MKIIISISGRSFMKSRLISLALTAVFLVSACGGSGGGGATTNSSAIIGVTVDNVATPTKLMVANTDNQTIQTLTLSNNAVATLAGSANTAGTTDGTSTAAKFYAPFGITLSGSDFYVADTYNHAIRKVTKAGAVVSTLAGNGEAGFADGQGADARFNQPHIVVVAANGDFIVSDCRNHCLRVVTPEGAVRTLVGNGQPGFADGQGADARFNQPAGLAMDPEGNVLVADWGNHAIRKVTMAGVVSTGKSNSGAP